MLNCMRQERCIAYKILPVHCKAALVLTSVLWIRIGPALASVLWSSIGISIVEQYWHPRTLLLESLIVRHPSPNTPLHIVHCPYTIVAYIALPLLQHCMLCCQAHCLYVAQQNGSSVVQGSIGGQLFTFRET